MADQVRSRLPHNPGVRELVEGKRRWSSPQTKEEAVLGFRGWHERGYIPHRDQPGLTQFITFRLADSLPAGLRSEWTALLKIEDDKKRREQLEGYLDKGKGEYFLQRPEIGRIIDEVLRFHHGRWYELLAWVIMPNHIHLLLKTMTTPLSKIIKELKRYTARKANKILHQTGGFWSEDFWDTYMRDAEHESKARRYIESNPVKAHLTSEPKEWPLGSARLRDKFGVLRL